MGDADEGSERRPALYIMFNKIGWLVIFKSSVPMKDERFRKCDCLVK